MSTFLNFHHSAIPKLHGKARPRSAVGYYEIPLGSCSLASTSFTRQRFIKTPLVGAGNARASNTWYVNCVWRPTVFARRFGL